MGQIVLHVRLGSATYRVLFVIAEQWAISMIIATSSTSRNVKVIMCMDQWIYLTRSEVPILAQHQGRCQMSKEEPQQLRSPSTQERQPYTTESNLNAPNTMLTNSDANLGSVCNSTFSLRQGLFSSATIARVAR